MSPRQLLALALAALLLVASAVGDVYVQHQRRARFRELVALERARDALQIEWGRLQLEQSTWANHDRIERIARRRLGLHPPRPQQTVVVIR